MQIIGEQSEEEGVGGEKAMGLSCSLVKCEAQTKAQIKQRTRRKTLNEQAEKGQLRITQDSEFSTGSLTFCMQFFWSEINSEVLNPFKILMLFLQYKM